MVTAVYSCQISSYLPSFRELFTDVDADTLSKLLDQHEIDFIMFGYDIKVFREMLKEKQSRR